MKPEQVRKMESETLPIQETGEDNLPERPWVRVTENRETKTFQVVFIMEFVGVVKGSRSGRNQ